MGQFDSPTEAALSRLKSESLFSSSVDGKVEKAAGIGAYLLEVAGFAGASGGVRFLSALKNLAANKDEANLIYFGEALVDDIRRLYRLHEELRHQFDNCLESSEFNAAVANATLHITRTNVEIRLKRLSHLIVNGVEASDLEPEGLDDMMRAAVELKDEDIILLDKLYASQNRRLLMQVRIGQSPDWWHGSFQTVWQEFINSGALNRQEHLKYRSSFARLESAGLVQHLDNVGTYGIGCDPYALLFEGKKFHERLQEIPG
jgi:hypothetical protein